MAYRVQLVSNLFPANRNKLRVRFATRRSRTIFLNGTRSGVGARYTFPGGQAADTAFHTYGIIWTQNEMQFFVHNASSPFFTVTPSSLPSGDTWPFNHSIFTLLNVAVGGTLGGSTSGLTNPGPMIVDSVRWYTAQ